ncbi:mandelate racemase/muconate lactonizing enzyme family protein [Marinobacterium jannaschii]|uniref:mandelate racemase/muconate lactonizing enzyme family protein n=1 Tax=Marinobacterium jannaschii TaxID=64970 RepID=UPI0004893F79|nr:mandelate racemase/muconate lactonizing enzyme family protein [Marinobacterium jannaschii]
MSVRIEKVEVFCLQDPQADFVRFEGSYQNLLVVVHGDNGLYGIGESDSPPQVVRALIESPPYNHLSCGLAALLEGEVLDDPRRLWHKMYQKTNWHGRHGVAIHAISALDIALWDLFARSEGKPLHHYFGGLKHQRLPAYATIYPMAAEPKAFKAQIGPYLEQGFRRLKICVEPWWQDIDATIENLSQLRAFVGPDIELMLDVAMEFTRYEQLEPFIRLLEELDFKWIEAPFELDNLADHRRLKTETYVPVGVGDLGFTTVKEFIPYLDADAFDIAQPDITLFGGVSEMIKLQALLQPAGKRIVPHGYNTEITLALNSQFLAAQPLVEPLEYSTSPSILRQKLISNPIRINAEGMAEVPEEGLGLGIELNWDLVKRCSV